MSLSIRQSEILEIARSNGKVIVDDLAERFEVSVQTIRKDLSDLDQQGHLNRVHGGAILTSGVTNIEYEDRRAMNDAAKQCIAVTCAQAIPNNTSIFLNIGTSTEAVAQHLLHHKNLLVVTNNMNVANILVHNPDCEVIVAGGILRRTDGGLVGTLTSRTIEQFKFDYAVIGCSAMDEDGDLLDFDIREVGVSQSILHQARKTYLVADQSKWNRPAPSRIASLKDIDTLFTDAPVSRNIMEKCHRWHTDIKVCTSLDC